MSSTRTPVNGFPHSVAAPPPNFSFALLALGLTEAPFGDGLVLQTCCSSSTRRRRLAFSARSCSSSLKSLELRLRTPTTLRFRSSQQRRRSCERSLNIADQMCPPVKSALNHAVQPTEEHLPLATITAFYLQSLNAVELGSCLNQSSQLVCVHKHPKVQQLCTTRTITDKDIITDHHHHREADVASYVSAYFHQVIEKNCHGFGERLWYCHT